jgi:hypothetical protein
MADLRGGWVGVESRRWRSPLAPWTPPGQKPSLAEQSLAIVSHKQIRAMHVRARTLAVPDRQRAYIVLSVTDGMAHPSRSAYRSDPSRL